MLFLRFLQQLYMIFFRYVVLAYLCVAPSRLWAQQQARVATHAATQPPQYVGGADRMLSDLQRNTRYPAAALRAQASGRVIVSFVVEADGSVGEASIISSPSPLLNDAVLQAVKGLGAFTPALANGKPIRDKVTCPVTFRMTSSGLTTEPVGPAQPQALPSAGNTVVPKLISFRDSTHNPDKKSSTINQHHFTYNQQGQPETHRLDHWNNGRLVSSQVLRYQYRPDGLVAAKISNRTKYLFDYTTAGQLSEIKLFLLMKQKWCLVEETQLVEKNLRKNGRKTLSLIMRKAPANPLVDSVLHVHSTIDYTLSNDNAITKSAVLIYDYKNWERPSTYTFKQDAKPNPFENLFVERWYQFELERSGPHNLTVETQNDRPFKIFTYTYNTADLPTQCRISNGVGQTYRVQNYAYAGIVVPAARPLAALAPDSVSELFIYPNPVNSTATIEAASIKPGETTLRLIDSGGKLVRQTTHTLTTTFSVNLSVEGLAKGVYVVEVIGAGAAVKGKLLVE